MLRIGLIGAGRIGRVHAQGIMTQVRGATVAAVADPSLSDEARGWLAGLGIMRHEVDPGALIRDPQIDAVLIGSPTTTHRALSLAAITAGKHVLCEKPVSQDINEVREVIAAVEAANARGAHLKYMVAFNRRFDHNVRAVKAAVDAGSVGEVHYVRITSRDPVAPPPSYVKDSGGMFMDMSVHDFDMAAFLTGSVVEEVYAAGANLVDPQIGEAGDIDTAVITLRMASGAMVVIDNSRQAVYGYDQRVEVFGSKGAVESRNDTASSVVLSTVEGVIHEKPLFFFLERYLASYAAEVQAFVDAIAEDQQVPISCAEGLQPILVAEAANRSIRENRPVRLSEIV